MPRSQITRSINWGAVDNGSLIDPTKLRYVDGDGSERRPEPHILRGLSALLALLAVFATLEVGLGDHTITIAISLFHQAFGAFVMFL